MSMISCAGFAGANLGLFLGLPFAGELERPMPARLFRFSLWWKMSMTAGLRSELNFLSTVSGRSLEMLFRDFVLL